MHLLARHTLSYYRYCIVWLSHTHKRKQHKGMVSMHLAAGFCSAIRFWNYSVVHTGFWLSLRLCQVLSTPPLSHQRMATLTETLGNIAPRNSAVLRAATRAEKMPEYLAKQLEVIIFVQGRDIFTVLPTSCGNNMLWLSCSRENF